MSAGTSLRGVSETFRFFSDCFFNDFSLTSWHLPIFVSRSIILFVLRGFFPHVPEDFSYSWWKVKTFLNLNLGMLGLKLLGKNEWILKSHKHLFWARGLNVSFMLKCTQKLPNYDNFVVENDLSANKHLRHSVISWKCWELKMIYVIISRSPNLKSIRNKPRTITSTSCFWKEASF